ncbi:CPBP family intramembrane glutamic endopeptidase [Clostridium estertheticum]|uniref:CPBP family intramembrane glutamic endopeptidase n=1 Tax=Clostridium estertheticum TaxID=238834 RepID=UPI001C0BB7FB|nr:type II CAAX endopeptidase family protein [Clostridium estertheticum]MBU3071834.1 CPBP family intramembrane metalloprotease [Clostridium estertheticum]MBU3161926.1 CPBP family intramembrane metalloprotease [Clostridium estertheticum]MBU3171236.1 CPBP family intramembrane metalloprotease [Clostridium estertheticum]
MNFLRNIEKGTISIKEMTIKKAFFIMILTVLLELLGQIPIVIINILSKKYSTVLPYIDLVADVIIKFFVITFLLKLYSKMSYDMPRKQCLDTKKFIRVAVIIIGFRLAYDNSLIYLVDKIPMPDFISQAFGEMSISPIILILSVAVIAPIYEEVIIRGILLKGMANKMNPNLALIISALIFALAHMNIPQGINAFLLGLIIGAIYLSSDSIYLCIFAHFINNSVAITTSGSFQLLSGKYSMIIHSIFFLVGITILIFAYRWYTRKQPEDTLDIYKEFIER